MVFLSDSDSENLNKNKTFPGPRTKVTEPEKNPKMNMTKQNYCDLHRNLTFVIF